MTWRKIKEEREESNIALFLWAPPQLSMEKGATMAAPPHQDYRTTAPSHRGSFAPRVNRRAATPAESTSTAALWRIAKAPRSPCPATVVAMRLNYPVASLRLELHTREAPPVVADACLRVALVFRTVAMLRCLHHRSLRRHEPVAMAQIRSDLGPASSDPAVALEEGGVGGEEGQRQCGAWGGRRRGRTTTRLILGWPVAGGRGWRRR